METDLARFLREYRDDNVDFAGRLRPFAAMAGAGSYRLAQAEAIDPAVLAAAIAAATGRPVKDITPLAADAMVATMSPGQRADHLAAAGATIKDGLWLRLLYEHSSALDAALGGPEVKERLYAGFAASLGLPLRRAFERRFRPVIGAFRWHGTSAALGDILLLGGWNGVEEALFYWMAFSLAGDPRAERLSPLVDLLSNAVPLCESAKEPGVWLALTE